MASIEAFYALFQQSGLETTKDAVLLVARLQTCLLYLLDLQKRRSIDTLGSISRSKPGKGPQLTTVDPCIISSSTLWCDLGSHSQTKKKPRSCASRLLVGGCRPVADFASHPFLAPASATCPIGPAASGNHAFDYPINKDRSQVELNHLLEWEVAAYCHVRDFRGITSSPPPRDSQVYPMINFHSQTIPSMSTSDAGPGSSQNLNSGNTGFQQSSPHYKASSKTSDCAGVTDMVLDNRYTGQQWQSMQQSSSTYNEGLGLMGSSIGTHFQMGQHHSPGSISMENMTSNIVQVDNSNLSNSLASGNLQQTGRMLHMSTDMVSPSSMRLPMDASTTDFSPTPMYGVHNAQTRLSASHTQIQNSTLTTGGNTTLASQTHGFMRNNAVLYSALADTSASQPESQGQVQAPVGNAPIMYQPTSQSFTVNSTRSFNPLGTVPTSQTGIISSGVEAFGHTDFIGSSQPTMLGGQSNNPDSSIISASQTTIPTSDCMPGSDDEGNTLDSSIISRHEKPMNQSIYDALLPGNSSPSFKDVISPKVHPGSMNRKSSIQPVAESKVSFIAATPNAMSSNTEGQKSTAPQNAQKAQQSMNATMNLNVGDWGNISNTGSFGMDSISSNSNLVESARYSFSTEMEPIPLSNTTAAADGPNSSFPSGLGSSELLPPGSRQALLYQNMIPISGPETMQAGSLSIPFPVSTHNLTPASQLMAAPETAQESTVTLLIDKSHFEAFIQGDPEATKLVQAKAKAKSEAQNEAKRRQQQRPQIEQPRQSQRSKQVQTSSGLKSRQVSVEPPTAESRPVTQQCNQSPSRSSAGPETPVSRAELTSTGPSSQSFKPSPKSTHISRPPTQPQTIVVNHPQFRGLQYADGQLYDPEGGRASNESQTKAKAKVKAKAETESNNSQTQGQDAQRIQKAKREAQPEQTQSQPQQQAQVQAQFQAQAHAQAQAQRQAQAQAVQAQVQAGAHAQLRAAQEGQLRQTHVGPGIQHPQIIPPPFGQNMPESPWSPSSGLSGNLNPQWPNQQVQPLMTPQQAMQHSGSPIFSPQSSLAHFNQVPSRYAGAARGLHQNSFASQIPTQRPIAHAHMNNLALVNTVMPQAMRQRGGLTRTMSECDGYSEDFQYQPMKRQRGMDIGATTGVPVFNSGHMVPSVDMQSVNFGRRPSGATYVLATGPHSPNRAPMAPHSPASREIENQASKLPAQSPTGPQPPSHSQTQMQQPQTPHCQNQVANANTPARSGSIHNVSSSMTGLQPTTPVTMSGQPGGFGGPVSGGSHNQSGTCFLGSDTMESG